MLASLALDLVALVFKGDEICIYSSCLQLLLAAVVGRGRGSTVAGLIMIVKRKRQH
jgi:hypothetical protein